MSRFGVLPLIVWAGLLGLSARARADSAPAEHTEQTARTEQIVVMVVDPEVLPLARRLQQEVEALGLTVRLIAADAPRAASLKNDAVSAGAVAAIHLAPVGGGDVDMTILDGATGKTVSWKIAAATPDAPAPLDLIATRTVELLRASLLQLAARRKAEAEAEAAARAEAARPITPPPKAAPPEQQSSLSLAVGPALLYCPHFSAGAELQSSLIWLPFPHWGLSFAALAPLAAARLDRPQGSVEAFATLYRLGPALQIGELTSAFTVRSVAGVELASLRFEGEARAPYRSATDARATWSPFASAAARFRVTPGLYVVTELAAGLALPSTIVRVAGGEVTSWGRPLGTASLALELALPTPRQE